jgi:hypothetical protein
MHREQYSDEEIGELIRRAAEIQGTAETDRAILQRTASEMGISEDALKQAEEEMLVSRRKKNDLAEFKKHRLNEFLEHLVTYGAVNGFLFFLDVRDGHLTWFWYPLFGWGIAIVIHMATALMNSGSEFDKDFARWHRRRERRARRHSG